MPNLFARYHIKDILLLCLVTFAVYGRVLSHDFVNWDDESYVVFNQAITGFSWSHLKEAFSTCYVGNYAPLQMISYMLDYTLWGLRPGGFLLTNVVFHLANGIIWYRMMFRWYSDRLIALIAACLFIVHPVQVETVSWVSQRKNLLALFLFLIAWECYCRYREIQVGKTKSVTYIVSVAAFGLALLSKSVVVIFPLVLVCYDYCFENVGNRFNLKDKLPFVFLAVAGMLLAVFSQSQGFGGGRIGYHGDSAWHTFLTMLPVLCSYVTLIIWPTNLNALYLPLVHTSADGAVLAAALFLLALTATGVLLYRRNRKSGFWALLCLIALLPVLQIIPLNTLISDRYLYFPMLGVSALAGTGCGYVKKRFSERFRYLQRFLVVGLLIVLAILSIIRAEVWKDSLTLWKDTVAKAPQSSRAWGNLGAAYQREGLLQEAFAAYERGLVFDNDNEHILYNLGVMYSDVGNYEGADLCFKRLPKEFRIDGVVPVFNAGQAKP